MNNIQKQLAELDFCALLAEANANTATGSTLINKYRNYCSENIVNCAVINSFIGEAKRQTYDAGVLKVLESLADFINSRQISWQIASVCESIKNDKNPKNYLARNAASQAEQLLEMEESDVIKYIKAGALKNVQYVEQFRNITKAVLKESLKFVSEDAEYSVTTPISYVAQTEDGNYFRVLGKTYLIKNGSEISESVYKDNKFEYINALLESEFVTLKDDDTLSINYDGIEYLISEQGLCSRKSKTGTLCLETATLREYNQAALNTVLPSIRAQKAAMLETIALISENYDSIVHVDCASIYQTNDDKFLVIEGEEKFFAQLISSNHATSRWSINESAVDTVQFIKEKTHVNLASRYENKINENIMQVESDKKEQLLESIKQSEAQAVAKRIDALTEKYKNNPAMLNVIANIAAELA